MHGACPASSAIYGSMPYRFRKEIDDHDARYDEPKTYAGGQIQRLLEPHEAHDGNEYDAKSAPYGIGHTHRHGLQHMGERVERYDIAADGA